ncbi:uncharacterized protein BJ171DRAFT_490139 [Polychytrium aggregatum]|uniref:uncharacterized protein n=1 Tax=Polychytrium aggregatum TaxID=110093 RepID=UPI0022FEC79E|nr:uncharacterized protein BJ171DRAFT_490139 [Polychytrium aggregatum]KAI9208068.1 hypothetical protein BJ171DRAFT_490139 [Polychytrium aggregatum]
MPSSRSCPLQDQRFDWLSPSSRQATGNLGLPLYPHNFSPPPLTMTDRESVAETIALVLDLYVFSSFVTLPELLKIIMLNRSFRHRYETNRPCWRHLLTCLTQVHTEGPSIDTAIELDLRLVVLGADSYLHRVGPAPHKTEAYLWASAAEDADLFRTVMAAGERHSQLLYQRWAQNEPHGYLARRVERLVCGPNRLGCSELALCSLGLTSLPESIGVMAAMQTIMLYGNRLRELPQSIGALRHLSALLVGCNQLESIPECIGHLAVLTTLDLSSNQLQALPDSIVRLRRLTNLIVSGNQLKRLPEQIGQLASLQILRVDYNCLENLPDSLGQLSRLTDLFVDNNRLSALPDTVGELRQLRRLGAAGNQLAMLPESLGGLVGLELLDITGNQLASLPKPMDALTATVVLGMDDQLLERDPIDILRGFCERIGVGMSNRARSLFAFARHGP